MKGSSRAKTRLALYCPFPNGGYMPYPVKSLFEISEDKHGTDFAGSEDTFTFHKRF